MELTQEIDTATANTNAMPARALLSNLPFPFELRLQILGYALTYPVTINLTDEPSLIRRGTGDLNEHIQLLAYYPPACIWTTREIFAEAVPIFFKKNVFRVTVRALDEEGLAEEGIRFLRIGPNGMNWLRATGALAAPVFQEVVLDLHGQSNGGHPRFLPGMASFHLRYRDDREVEVVHQGCAFCLTHEWNLPRGSQRDQLPDLFHPSLADEDDIKRAYAETWRHHSHHLQYLNKWVHALDLSPLGATLIDIDRVTDVIRSSLGARAAIVPPMTSPTFNSVSHFVTHRLEIANIVNALYRLREEWEAQQRSEITARQRDRVRNFAIAVRTAAAHGHTLAKEAQQLAIALKIPKIDSEATWESLSSMQDSSNDFHNEGNMLNARVHIAVAQKTFNKLLMSVSRMQAELFEARDQFGALAY